MKKIQRYAELKLQEKEIKKELSILKSEVSNIVHDEDGERLETKWGEFKIVGAGKKWKYSDELLAKEIQVKEVIKLKKREEELKGVAELISDGSRLVFKAGGSK